MKNFFLKLSYNFFIFLLLPVFWLLLKRHHQSPSKSYWRLGIIKKQQLPTSVDIWFHAASFGEINASAPLLEDLIEQKKSLLISTMTLTGFKRAQELFPSATQVLIPIDFYPFAKKFIKTIAPKKIIFFETEIWANFWWIAKSKKIPLFVVNGRISPTSYKSYKKLKFLFSSVLKCAEKINCISYADAERYKNLGANPQSIEVSGNIKLKAKRHSPSVDWAKNYLKKNQHLKDKKILLCASTHKGEDQLLLEIFSNLRQEFNKLVLILVPRHPERFLEVENSSGAYCKNKGYKLAKFSQIKTNEQEISKNGKNLKTQAPVEKPSGAWDILLGDTMGDMHKFYALADFTFVAGSLIKGIGGHNFLEAGIYLKPTISGKHIENFSEIGAQMAASGALDLIENPQELQALISKLLQNSQLVKQKSKALKDFFAQQQKLLAPLINSYDSAS